MTGGDGSREKSLKYRIVESNTILLIDAPKPLKAVRYKIVQIIVNSKNLRGFFFTSKALFRLFPIEYLYPNTTIIKREIHDINNSKGEPTIPKQNADE
jgi:hypothetical protein